MLSSDLKLQLQSKGLVLWEGVIETVKDYDKIIRIIEELEGKPLSDSDSGSYAYAHTLRQASKHDISYTTFITTATTIMFHTLTQSQQHRKVISDEHEKMKSEKK